MKRGVKNGMETTDEKNQPKMAEAPNIGALIAPDEEILSGFRNKEWGF